MADAGPVYGAGGPGGYRKRDTYRGLFPSPLYLTECLLIGPKENAA